MNIKYIFCSIALISIMFLTSYTQPKNLKSGDKAPEFKAKAILKNKEIDINCRPFSRGKFALAFYPQDGSPFCRKQLDNLQAHKSALDDENITFIGCNTDSLDSHRQFANNHNFEFALISDKNGSISKKYGTYSTFLFFKQYSSRETFLIKDGTIIDIIKDVNLTSHAQQIIDGFKKNK